MAAAESFAAGSGWRGALSLELAPRDGRTVLVRRVHEGPFCVQRPFYPADGACHVYLLHPPGGLAGGDELVLDVGVADGANALLTTPAATKFYRTDNAVATQSQTLRVRSRASLEWLPQESILFGGSRARIATDVHLASGARFVGWDLVSLGRPLSGDRYRAGSLTQHTRVFVNGDPLLLESMRWRAGDALLTAPWGLDWFGVCGALYAFPAGESLLTTVRERLGIATPSIDDADSLAAAPGLAHAVRTGVTLLGDLLVIRALAHEPEALRLSFEALWSMLRADVIGLAARTPRIWKT